MAGINPFAYGDTNSPTGLNSADQQANPWIQQPSSDTASYLKNSTLYDYASPTSSFRNVLADNGYNPYAANPFMQVVQNRLAPSLGNSFQRTMATTGANVNDAMNSGSYFNNYLNNLLKNGGLASAPMSGGAGIGNMVQGAREVRQAQMNGTPVTQMNPFSLAMSEQLGANGGRGTVDAISQAYTPYMNKTMATAFNNMLNANYETAIRNMAANPLDPSKDIWTYLLGM